MKIFRLILKILLLSAQAVASSLIALVVFKLNILQLWQHGLIALALVLLLSFSIWKLFAPKAKNVTKVIAVLLSLLTILASGAGFYYLRSISGFVEGATAKEDTSENNPAESPFLVYISGTDSREGIDGVARSDVNILAAVNPKTAKILLLTIPRDTYVQLHGTTGIKDKLTHAGTYGIEMSKSTIEDFLSVEIDYTVKVSFETVVSIIDAIDGI